MSNLELDSQVTRRRMLALAGAAAGGATVAGGASLAGVAGVAGAASQSNGGGYRVAALRLMSAS